MELRALNYRQFLNNVIQAKKMNHFREGKLVNESFLKERDIKLFQFSQYPCIRHSYVFLKYFPALDSYQGDFSGLKKLLEDGLSKLNQ